MTTYTYPSFFSRRNYQFMFRWKISNSQTSSVQVVEHYHKNQPIDAPTHAQKMSATDVNGFSNPNPHHFVFPWWLFNKIRTNSNVTQVDQHGEGKNWNLTPKNHTTVNPKQWLDSKCFWKALSDTWNIMENVLAKMAKRETNLVKQTS